MPSDASKPAYKRVSKRRTKPTAHLRDAENSNGANNEPDTEPNNEPNTTESDAERGTERHTEEHTDEPVIRRNQPTRKGLATNTRRRIKDLNRITSGSRAPMAGVKRL